MRSRRGIGWVEPPKLVMGVNVGSEANANANVNADDAEPKAKGSSSARRASDDGLGTGMEPDLIHRLSFLCVCV